MDDVNRRRFLGTAIGTGAAAAAAGAWTPAARATGGGGGGGRGQVPNNRIGIQLYTMRRLMPANDRQAVRRVLNWLGRTGYTQVEMAGYYGFTARQVRNWLDDAGLRAVSGHDPLDITVPDGQWESKYQKTLEDANTMGQKLTGFAWFPGPYTAEYFTFLADRFNKAGAMAARAGLQFFYHNHDFEFTNKQADGTPVYDILLEQTDPNLVKFELDLFWIIEGGENPLEYLARPRPVPRLPREGSDVEGPAERAGLRGRRSRRDRLPGHLRRGPGPPAGQALLHRARRAGALAPGRPRGGVQDRAGGRELPAHRALVADA